MTVAGLDADYLEITMTALLVAVAVYTIVGGMLCVLVTDYLQFVVMSVGLLAVTLVTLYQVPWQTLVDTVEQNYGAGGFNAFINEDLGWSCVIFNGMLNTAAVLTWQTTIARVLSAKDTDTGRKIYTRTSFFFVCRFLIPGMWGMAALATVGAGRRLEPGHARVLEHLGAGGADGPVGRGHAGGRHVDRLLLHARPGAA